MATILVHQQTPPAVLAVTSSDWRSIRAVVGKWEVVTGQRHRWCFFQGMHPQSHGLLMHPCTPRIHCLIRCHMQYTPTVTCFGTMCCRLAPHILCCARCWGWVVLRVVCRARAVHMVQAPDVASPQSTLQSVPPQDYPVGLTWQVGSICVQGKLMVEEMRGTWDPACI